MERRRFGSTNREVAVIGQGTWNIERDDRGAAVAALRRGLDLGMTHIDTAEMYGDAEELVGEAIAGRRDEVFLVSKVLPENASRRGPLAACERSLDAPAHGPARLLPAALAGQHPLEDTIAAFEQLRRGGKILSWGVSNFDVADLEEARRSPARAASRATRCSTTCRSAPSSTPCSPGARSTTSPWSPTARSATGAFPARAAGGRVLQEIAAAHGATPRQVALASWCAGPRSSRSPRPPAGPRRGERGGRRSRADRSRPRPDRRRLPARPAAARAADALASASPRPSPSARPQGFGIWSVLLIMKRSREHEGQDQRMEATPPPIESEPNGSASPILPTFVRTRRRSTRMTLVGIGVPSK